VPTDNRHKAWLRFVNRALDVPLGYSKEDLWSFRSIAKRELPSLVPVIEALINLSESAETEVEDVAPTSPSRIKPSQMHLFDLLREKKFFPQNLDLATFASRVMPHMRPYRFDKMSRSDIAARIVEHIEESDPSKRAKLEKSMRQALSSMTKKPPKEIDRRSFLSRWEKIIKGLEL
jgi:hypothetical protein